MPTLPFGGLEQLAWSPDGKYIAYSCRKVAGKKYAFSTNTEIYLYNVVTGETSVIDMNGHNLTIGDGVSFVFEVGGQALAQLIDPNSEESYSFELELFRNVDTLTLDNKTIEELIADSEFVITSDEEGLLDGRYDGWAGMNITEHITSALYTEEDGTVVLNVTMTAVPEPTTATLSLLALAALAARRRRR